MKSIVFKLTVIMVSIALISVVITVAIAVIISGSQLQDMAQSQIEAETMAEAHSLEGWIDRHQANVNTLARILSVAGDYSHENIRPMLKSVLDVNNEYTEVYLGFADDTAVMGSGFAIETLYGPPVNWKATQTGWYQLALSNPNATHITAPYIDTSTGELVITAAQAVRYEGQIIGVVGVDILLTEVNNMIMNIKLEGRGYAMLLDPGGNVLAHPGDYAPDMRAGTFHNFNDMENGHFRALWNMAQTTDDAYRYDDAQGVSKFYTVHTIDETEWKLLTIIETSNLTQLTIDLILVVLPITLGIMIVAAIIIVMTAKNVIAKPINKITRAAEALATGDIELDDLDNDTTPTQNEIVKLERSFSQMVESFKKQAYVLARIAEGDYTSKVEVRSDKDVINSAIELVLDGTLDVLGQVATAGIAVAESSKEIAEGANSLALGASDQAATVQELSATMSVIADKTKDNAGMASRAASLANTIKNNAEEGSQQMEAMMDAVKEINQASQDIGKVIKVIDDIAFQTNILALNAAVEAARAGQHGKGFAVVAEEVRNLAAKSADAAKNSGSMISNSMEKAELGTRIATETSASLSKIVEGINESAQIVSDIAASSNEQTVSIDQINSAIEQVAQVVQQNSQTAEKSADASKAMSRQSVILEDLIKQFQLKSDMRGQKSLPSHKKQ